MIDFEVLTPEELAAIRERAEKATPGPWEVQENDWRDDEEEWPEVRVVAGTARRQPDGRYNCCTRSTDTIYENESCDEDEGEHRYRDAIFIATSRTDIPRLLDEVERLQKFVSAVKAAYECDFPDEVLYDAVTRAIEALDLKGNRIQ